MSVYNSRMTRGFALLFYATAAAIAFGTVVRADDDVAEEAFFEQRIRPVLVKHCYKCHSGEAKSVKGGLRLDTRALSREGGDSGAAIVPGDVEKSLLVRALRQEDFEMPPSGRLANDVIQDFERWIKMGAVDPRDSAATVAPTFDLRQRATEHWSWKPIARPEIPTDTPRPIDHFIGHRLDREELEPAAEADRRTLIRRLKLDLVGLPPTREEIRAFLADESEAAFATLVDRWLDSPHFGEKWASHWLDVMRFAETKGHVTDQERPYVWKYRDYVIDALNDDLPFDRFVIEHVAGDLLPVEQHRPGRQGQTNIAPTATGALFMHEMHFMAVDPVRQRWDQIDAQIDTLGQAFLGLTLGCARCHDHKFDAVSQRDYYSLAGFFYSTEQGKSRTAPRVELTPEQLADVQKLEDDYEQFLAGKINARKVAQSPKAHGYFPISEELGVQSPNDTKQLQTKMAALQKADPSWAFWVRAAKDVDGQDVTVMIRGDYRKPGETAKRGFLTAISGDNQPAAEMLGAGSGRMWLAKQIADPTNPLTARVWVNRLWHHLFGRGIVATPNNFGKLGGTPSHPELLDYLASQLVASGWSTKAIIREIVLSNVYRRSSQTSEEAQRVDPNNRWLSHHNQRRLPAELIRDNILAVAGSLDRSMHGPSVAGFVPPYATANKPTNVPKSGPLDGHGRRSVYLRVRRNFYDQMLLKFDFPDRGKSVGQRSVTTVPSQALAMLNGPFVHQQAERWGKRIAAQQGSETERLARTFETATGRLPDESEAVELQELVSELSRSSGDRVWQDVAHVLFNLYEFSVVE